MQRILRSAFLAAILLGTAWWMTSAQAALINFSFEGTVGSTLSGPGIDPFGLTTGDMISVMGTYDDSVIPGGSGSTSFALPGEGFTITVGALTLLHTDSLGSSLTLAGGTLLGFGYLFIEGLTGPVGGLNFGTPLDFSFSFTSEGFTVAGDGGLFGGIEPDTFAVSAPEPGLVGLLAIGVAGAAVMRRRKRA